MQVFSKKKQNKVQQIYRTDTYDLLIVLHKMPFDKNSQKILAKRQDICYYIEVEYTHMLMCGSLLWKSDIVFAVFHAGEVYGG